MVLVFVLFFPPVPKSFTSWIIKSQQNSPATNFVFPFSPSSPVVCVCVCETVHVTKSHRIRKLCDIGGLCNTLLVLTVQ